MINLSKKRQKAFTLAEVLITLGIIGVVSAMTVPALVRHHQKTVFVNQLRKTYSLLAQAAENALQETNATSLTETEYNQNSEKPTEKFLNKYFKVVKMCTDGQKGCLAEKYKNIKGENVTAWWNDYRPCASIAGGITICLLSSGFGEMPGRHSYLPIVVDVNGVKGPNVIGRDLFYIEMYDDGKIAEAYDPENIDPDASKEKCVNIQNL